MVEGGHSNKGAERNCLKRTYGYRLNIQIITMAITMHFY